MKEIFIEQIFWDYKNCRCFEELVLGQINFFVKLAYSLENLSLKVFKPILATSLREFFKSFKASRGKKIS